jgi:hypothetical protein
LAPLKLLNEKPLIDNRAKTAPAFKKQITEGQIRPDTSPIFESTKEQINRFIPNPQPPFLINKSLFLLFSRPEMP